MFFFGCFFSASTGLFIWLASSCTSSVAVCAISPRSSESAEVWIRPLPWIPLGSFFFVGPLGLGFMFFFGCFFSESERIGLFIWLASSCTSSAAVCEVSTETSETERSCRSATSTAAVCAISPGSSESADVWIRPLPWIPLGSFFFVPPLRLGFMFLMGCFFSASTGLFLWLPSSCTSTVAVCAISPGSSDCAEVWIRPLPWIPLGSFFFVGPLGLGFMFFFGCFFSES